MLVLVRVFARTPPQQPRGGAVSVERNIGTLGTNNEVELSSVKRGDVQEASGSRD